MIFQEEAGSYITIKCKKCGTNQKIHKVYCRNYGDEYHFNPPVTCVCGSTKKVAYKNLEINTSSYIQSNHCNDFIQFSNNLNGEYNETLPFGQGTLIVKKNVWYIRFYFPGIDRRYNGTFFSIYGQEVDKYINAYESNWIKFQEARKLNLDGELIINGDMDMTIFVRGIFTGICINSYHMPIATKDELEAIIQSLLWAKSTAEEVMILLNEMG